MRPAAWQNRAEWAEIGRSAWRNRRELLERSPAAVRAVVEATRPVWELLRDLALVPWRPLQAVLGEDAEDVAANLAQTAAAFRGAAERARAAARRAREVSVPPLRASSLARLGGSGPGLTATVMRMMWSLTWRRRALFLPGLAAGVRLRLPGPPAAAQGSVGRGGERRHEGGRRQRRNGGRDGAGGGGGEAGRGAGPATKPPRLNFWGGRRPGRALVHFMQPWNPATPPSLPSAAAAAELAAFRGPELRPLPAPALAPWHGPRRQRELDAREGWDSTRG